MTDPIPMTDERLAEIEELARPANWMSPVLVKELATEVRRLHAAVAEMTRCRDVALFLLDRDDYQVPVDLRDALTDSLCGIARWDAVPNRPDAAPDWLLDAIMSAVRPHYARAVERADKAEAKVAELDKRDAWLCALEAAGVDNWEGCSRAQDLLDEWEREDQEKKA
jgi:hypothetical protein